ncbi:MAG: PstS family phosphate ABC transporter substrate-binding protein [Flammeovirgaceae bacterium]
MIKKLSFLVCLVLVGCYQSSSFETVVIRGSDTEVNLVLQLAEIYMESDPNVSIAVTGGGSGTGIASLINKKTDIANSSRAFKASELELAKSRGVDVIPLVFAVDALCFIVHESLAVDSLSLSQIRSIYMGHQQNWETFGGPDQEISLYGRQGNSGTFTFIQQEILKADYSLKMKQMNGTAQIIESIKQDKAGIGYVGIGYLLSKEGELIDGVKVLSIKKDQQEDAINPLILTNIKQGIYPIIRPLYQYIDGTPSGKLKDFILFELSDEGQTIIGNNGYFPISQSYRQQNLSYLNNEKKMD